MNRFPGRVAVVLGILLNCIGCISVDYHGKTFPATEDLQIFYPGQQPSTVMQVIGRGVASGEYSGTSNADLIQELKEVGMQHGAKVMLIVGSRIVPAGKIANAAQSDFIIATDDPDQQETEMAFEETINSNEFEGKTVFRRIIYAEFLR